MKSFVDAIRKLSRLPGQERRLLVWAWLLLIVADLALRLLPFTTVMERCRRRNARRNRPPADAPLPASCLARLVETAGRYCPAGTSCLKEAMVLSWLLARMGMSATLRIGVGRPAGAFSAHAWLEQDGRVILGDRERDAYAPLLSLRQ